MVIDAAFPFATPVKRVEDVYRLVRQADYCLNFLTEGGYEEGRWLSGLGLSQNESRPQSLACAKHCRHLAPAASEFAERTTCRRLRAKGPYRKKAFSQC